MCSWTVRVHDIQAVLQLEWEQTLLCVATKMNGSMNLQMYKRETKIVHRERVSMNVWKYVGHPVLIKMCKENSKRGRYHFYSDINYACLASLVGIDLLQRNIQGKKFFVASIDMKYNEDNMMFKCGLLASIYRSWRSYSFQSSGWSKINVR